MAVIENGDRELELPGRPSGLELDRGAAAGRAARPAVSSRPPGRALLPAILFAAAALFELGRGLVAPARVAADADWAAAARWTRERWRPGDLVTIAPAWADPVGRSHFSSDLLPREAAGRPDDARYARVFVVSTRGARAPEERARRETARARFGAVDVALWEGRAAEVVFDFVAHAPAGSIAHVRTAEVEFQPRRCLWMQSPGVPVSLDFGAVKLGTSIVGYTGLDSVFARKAGQGYFDLKVFVGGEQRLSVRHANRDGWKRFEVPTGGEDGRAASVRFEISAPDPRERRICIAAEARR